MLLIQKMPYLFFRNFALACIIMFAINHSLAQESERLEENFENAENVKKKGLNGAQRSLSLN